jgi:hypothetical protein
MNFLQIKQVLTFIYTLKINFCYYFPIFITLYVAELPELFQLKCPSPALEARPHLNGNNPSIPRI